ncbi:hypothetical protein [Methanosarcina sp.]|uniref:hypothetical protein n=1 Tax=Methanosarcina sp. TaxID=2213 RepID=UPI003BB61C32
MIESMKYEKDLSRVLSCLSTVIGLIPTVNVVPVEPVIKKIDGSQREILEEIRKSSEKIDDIKISLVPGISEELILHIGPMTPYGGVEYTLTIPLQGLSYPEIKEELKEIAGKRISQMSMLPKKTAKIVEDYFVKNKMEDLLNKLH